MYTLKIQEKSLDLFTCYHQKLVIVDLSKQATGHYSKKSQFLKTADKYLEEIFLHQDKWLDQFKKLGIKLDEGISHEFGKSEVWQPDVQRFKWVKHEDELWIRCDEDLKQTMRKIKIFSPIMKNKTKNDFKQLQRRRKEPPVITRAELEDTLQIARMFDNRDELLNYYTPSVIVESGEIKQHTYDVNPSKIKVKLQRRLQMKQMLTTNEVVSLTPCSKRKKQQKNCSGKKNFPGEMRTSLKCIELRAELRIHGEKVCGKKLELIQRLKTHYSEFHPDFCIVAFSV